MALPIALPAAISAIKALLRFRDRIDTILSLNETTTGLPFALPPTPTDDAPFLNDMLNFFKTDQGEMILHLRGVYDDFVKVSANPYSDQDPIAALRNNLFQLYYQAADVPPVPLGPNESVITKGRSFEVRLAYYVVESQRLSHNTALARVLLATADTLLEFAGENAGIFIVNPQTCSLVESLIEEFAGKRDFDDEGVETIFKSLLGSTLLALGNNPGELANEPALKALFAALGDVQKSMGSNFVAQIVSVDGFEQLIASYAKEVAKDPSFITQNVGMQKVLTATLEKVGTDFKSILTDPKAFLGVLEVGLGAAAANVDSILKPDLGSDPLLSAVLSAVLKEVNVLGTDNKLFSSIANGQFIPDIYKTVLQAVAATPIEFKDQSNVEKFVSDLIVGLAKALSQREISDLFSTDTLKVLASESLTVLSADPQFLTKNNQFATKLLAAVFQAGAKAISDGLTKEDLVDVARVAVKTASNNIALLGLDDQLAAVVSSVGDALAASDLQKLINAEGRKAAILAIFQAVAANPLVWGQLQEKDLVQPLVQAILQGLASDPTKLLSGPVLVDAVSRILLSAVRRGREIVGNRITTNDLKELLIKGLDRANQEIGKRIDGENLPLFLERVVSFFLESPFEVTGDPSHDFVKIADNVLAELSGLSHS